MEGSRAVLSVALLLVTQLSQGLASPVTVPSFLWSPQNYGESHYAVKEVINYRAISPKELAKSVLSEGSWSQILCSGENLQHNVDIALVFVGRKLRTSDISRGTSDPSLVDLLKLSFASSNVSMAFPYVAMPDVREKLENSLMLEFAEHCGNELEVDHIAYMDSCYIDNKDIKRLENLDSLHEFLSSRMESTTNRKTDMIVFCSGPFEEVENLQSDGEILSKLVIFLEQLGAKYTVLYASDPYRSQQHISYPLSERFLLEDALGNGLGSSSHCDEVCQIKSSLLEGLFVGLVLLIILISGLCCMMGIDTPSRFETPQDS